MVTQITSEKEFKEALSYDGVVVVDFFATWCGPCKMIAPVLEKFSQQYTSAKFIKVDVEEVNSLASEYEITAMPTFIVFKNGEIVQRVLGANPANLKKAIDASL